MKISMLTSTAKPDSNRSMIFCDFLSDEVYNFTAIPVEIEKKQALKLVKFG